MIRRFGELSPQLGVRVFVDASAQVIGDVTIGDDSSIWMSVTARGDVHAIRIGARTSVQDNSVLHVTHDSVYLPGGAMLTIGDDVTIGHSVVLHGCTIGHRCLIGMGAIILDRAVVEDEVLLAAGSVVPPGKVLQSGYLYRGSPAQQARPLNDTEREQLRYAAAHYVRLKDKYIEDGNRETGIGNR